jgi:hypothetical protein
MRQPDMRQPDMRRVSADGRLRRYQEATRVSGDETGFSQRRGIIIDLAQIRLAVLKLTVLIGPIERLVFERPFGVFSFDVIVCGSHTQWSH